MAVGPEPSLNSINIEGSENTGQRQCELPMKKEWSRSLTIPPSGIILTIKALHFPSFPFDPSSKICRLFGPRPVTGKISSHLASLGPSLTLWPCANSDGESVMPKTDDSGASLPLK